jgi:arsenate reductase
MNTMTHVFGITNCESVKKARNWLNAQGVPYTFHDFKKNGISPALIEGWLAQLDWETLLNRKGTTWRSLPEERKAAIVGADSAADLMLEFPSIIKRPVLVTGNQIHVGFSDALYQQIFTQ